MKTAYELIAQVVCKLARKPVQVRFKHNKGLFGLCRADSSGLVTIDIEPELQNYSRNFLEILLHETAHAKYENFLPMSFEASDSIPVQEGLQFDFSEFRAELQGAVWLWYAEKHRENNLDYLTGCLITLLEL